MKILALDTSSIAATAAVLDEKKIIAEWIVNHKKTHSQKLMPMIQEMLNHCELRPKDIDFFAVSLGPGSFTGLRIGVSTVKAMAQALDKPVIGVSTLDGLAYNLPYCEGIICPIIDAQKNFVYTGLYRWQQGEFCRMEKHCVQSIEELVQLLKKKEEKVVFVGDALEKYYQVLQEALGDDAQFPPDTVIFPRASSIGELARMEINKGNIQKAEEVVPVYMRKSQAERQYEEKTKGRIGTV